MFDAESHSKSLSTFLEALKPKLHLAHRHVVHQEQKLYDPLKVGIKGPPACGKTSLVLETLKELFPDLAEQGRLIEKCSAYGGRPITVWQHWNATIGEEEVLISLEDDQALSALFHDASKRPPEIGERPAMRIIEHPSEDKIRYCDLVVRFSDEEFIVD